MYILDAVGYIIQCLIDDGLNIKVCRMTFETCIILGQKNYSTKLYNNNV